MKAISAARSGGTILHSCHNSSTLCNRVRFLSLHLQVHPRSPPSLHLPPSRPSGHSLSISPKPLRFVLRAADSTQATSLSSSSAEKTVVADDDFSLAKVLGSCQDSRRSCFHILFLSWQGLIYDEC